MLFSSMLFCFSSPVISIPALGAFILMPPAEALAAG